MKNVNVYLECYTVIEIFNKIRDYAIKQVQDKNFDCIDDLLYMDKFDTADADSNGTIKFLQDIHKTFAGEVFPESFIVEFPNAQKYSFLVCGCDVTIISSLLYTPQDILSPNEVDALIEATNISEEELNEHLNRTDKPFLNKVANTFGVDYSDDDIVKDNNDVLSQEELDRELEYCEKIRKERENGCICNIVYNPKCPLHNKELSQDFIYRALDAVDDDDNVVTDTFGVEKDGSDIEVLLAVAVWGGNPDKEPRLELCEDEDDVL